jgi:glycosyltransferase 2 family protein
MQTMRKRESSWRRYRLAAVLGVAASIGATAFIIRQTGASLGEVVSLLPPWAHAAALAAIALHLGGRGVRLALVARGSGARLGVRQALAALLAGDAAAAVTPSRVGSDPAKLYMLAHAGHPLGTGASFVAGEMIAEVLMLTLVCAVLAAGFPSFRLPALGALSYAAVVLVSTSTLLVAGRSMRRRPLPGWLARVRLSPARWRAFRYAAVSFYRRTTRLRAMPPAAIAAVLLATLLHMGGRLAVLPLLASAVAPAAPTGMLVVWPLLFLYAGALLPPPAGGGAIEVAFAATVGDAVPAATIAGLLLWWRFYTFYLGAIIGGATAAFVMARRGNSAQSSAGVAFPAGRD